MGGVSNQAKRVGEEDVVQDGTVYGLNGTGAGDASSMLHFLPRVFAAGKDRCHLVPVDLQSGR